MSEVNIGMMKDWRKAVSSLLGIMLLIQLLFPFAYAGASAGTGEAGGVASNVNGVSGNVYGVTNQVYSVRQNVYAPGAIKENIITSVVIKNEKGELLTDIRPDQGTRVQLYFTWSLPAGHPYRAGATFTFQLPDKFKVDRLLTGDMEGGVGSYEVTPEGKVTFTFNEEVEDSGRLDGYFYVWREFDEGKFSGGTTQSIDFSFLDKLITIPVHFQNKGEDITKSGKADQVNNPGRIDWVVDFNKAENVLNGATLQDTLPAGLTVDMASIEVVELAVKLDGTVTEVAPYTRFTAQPTSSGFQMSMGNIDRAYRVKYSTVIKSQENKTYTNRVVVAANGNPKLLEKSSSVTVKFSLPLKKESTGYDSSTQTITWSIEYNYNEQSIPRTDAWIEDTFDTAQQELLENTFVVYAMDIDDDGTTKKSETPLTKGTDYTVTKTADGFKLSFLKAISGAYKIGYQTKATDRVYKESTIKNTVKMHNGTEASATRKMEQVIFWKEGGAIDYANKTIDWKLNLNKDNQTMSGIAILDTFDSQGLTLVESSLQIDGLTKGTDYTLAPYPTYGEGFKLTFLHPITASYEIKYKTSFDPAYFSPSEVRTKNYTNKGSLSWTENATTTKPMESTATVKFNDYMKKNGNKTGSYNAQTKEITWTIDVNYNRHQLNGATIRDFYTGKQTLVAGSLQVYRLSIQSGGGVAAGALVDPSAYTVTNNLKNAEGNNGFSLAFNGPIDSAYRLMYRTSLAAFPVLAEYKNDAIMIEAAVPGTNVFEESATVKPRFGGEYLAKSGYQGTGADQDFAYWQVNINRSQSRVDAGAKVTDTLSANQLIVEDSFKLYATSASGDGSLTKAGLVPEMDYTLVFGRMADGRFTFTLTFTKPLTGAYLLEYQTYLNAGHGEQAGNQAVFTGQSSGAVAGSDEDHFQVSFSGAGAGSNSPGKGTLRIHNEDASTHQPLAGASFELYNKEGDKRLAGPVVTNEQGIAEFKDLKFVDYRIREVSAPIGYLVDAEWTAVKFSETNKDVTVKNTKLHYGIVLKKVDGSDQSKLLAGAVFKLQKDNGGVYEDVAGQTSLTTSAGGTITLADLAPGRYQLIETKAPKGYKLDANPVAFTIDSARTTVQTLTKVNIQIDNGEGGGGGVPPVNPNPPVEPGPITPESPEEPDRTAAEPQPGQPGQPVTPAPVTPNPVQPTPNPVQPTPSPVQPGNPIPAETTPEAGKPTPLEPSPLPETASEQVEESGQAAGGNSQGSGIATGNGRDDGMGLAVLPKTGEESHLPLQLAGFGLLALGTALLVTRRRNRA